MRHRPATAIADNLAVDSNDSFAVALWRAHVERALRAAKTLRLIFPAVAVLIFVILYLTYKDLTDAALMMLAVPEALAGGVFFQFLFPKIVHGWAAPAERLR